MSQSAGRNPARTISREASLSGVSIHSGKECSLKFVPRRSPGIFFLHEGKLTEASYGNVSKTDRGTTLGNVNVVEHVLSAAYGVGIDSLIVELSSPEPPVIDGSALPFAEALIKAGPKELPFERKVIDVKRPVKLAEKDASIEVFPSDRFEIDFMVKFPVIGEQRVCFSGNYITEIAPARTFGFLSELEGLKKRGLALGASLDNALAIDETGYVNLPRFKDEPARHKVLDLIGDLALAGAFIRGKFVAVKSSHSLNVRIARLLAEQGGP